MNGSESLTLAQLGEIAARHGLLAPAAVLVSSGSASDVYVLDGALVLRVAQPVERPFADFAREAQVIRLARQAGVRTPELLATGHLPWHPETPYMLLERVHGLNLGTLDLAPGALPETYRELGRSLARWHQRPVQPDDPLADLPHDPHPDLRDGLEALALAGALPGGAADWLRAWLDRLAPLAARPAAWRVVHGDARPTNVLVGEADGAFLALLDWGDAHWADPASEFALLPLRAVPFALQGYRELRPAEADEVNEARVLWYQLGWAVHALGRAATGDQTWSAPPTGRLLELLRFYLEAPDEVWRRWTPLP